jgi:hypothetical protein
MNLVVAGVVFPYADFLQVTSDVVGGARVNVPVGVDSI